MLTSVLAPFLLTVPCSFAKETTAKDPYDPILLEHPTPQLSPDTWRIITTQQRGLNKPLQAKLVISVEKGQAKSVNIQQSTGFKPADDELVNWIETKWQFRPEITNRFNLPVELFPPAKSSMIGSRTIGKPLTLSKSDIAEGITIRTQKLLLNLEVDHGRIKQIAVLKSTGDPKLDAASVRWVKENWVFKKDQSGSFNLPVVFNKKE